MYNALFGCCGDGGRGKSEVAARAALRHTKHRGFGIFTRTPTRPRLPLLLLLGLGRLNASMVIKTEAFTDV